MMKYKNARRVILLLALAGLHAGCASLRGGDMRKNRIVAQTGLSNGAALRATNTALRDAGFRISRQAEDMGRLRTGWTQLGSRNAEMKVWADVELGEIRLRGWYRKGRGDDKVVSSPTDDALGKRAWEVIERIAQQLPGSIGYEYGPTG